MKKKESKVSIAGTVLHDIDSVLGLSRMVSKVYGISIFMIFMVSLQWLHDRENINETILA